MKNLTKAMLTLLIMVGITVGGTIKLGSLAPKNSPWDKALNKLAREWKTASRGKVTVKVYAGGIVGDEADMLRKMRINSLQAAAVTGLGLTGVAPDLLTIQLPMLFKSDAEFEYVLSKVENDYKSALEAKGIKLLAWTKVGWLHFFSKHPVTKVEDLQAQKFFVYQGDEKTVGVWRDGGFKPVPLSTNDMMTSLQSGMIESFASTSLSTAAFQWFGIANNMVDMNWSVLLGGIIINKKTWDRFPKPLQKKLEKIALNVGSDIQKSIEQIDVKAVETMKKNGLKVTSIPDSEMAKWQVIADKGAKYMIDHKAITQASYDKIKGYIAEYRLANK